jgi:hypothetical protein
VAAESTANPEPIPLLACRDMLLSLMTVSSPD